LESFDLELFDLLLLEIITFLFNLTGDFVSPSDEDEDEDF